MNPTTSRYRSRSSADKVVGFSVSFERENLLARGLGYEHLREMVLRMARPLLRRSASLAYGGNWSTHAGVANFTEEFLKLISDEQGDNNLSGPDSSLRIGTMINYLAWPDYLTITPRIEAQWINSCRIVRVSQEMAGLAPEQRLPDTEAGRSASHAGLNRAVVLSCMRRLAMRGTQLDHPDVPPERVPPVSARIMVGGRTTGYSGFLPGLLEEALVTLEVQRPLLILGGFGGSAELLARAMLGAEPLPELTLEWHYSRTPACRQLNALAMERGLPLGVLGTSELLERLHGFIAQAREDLVGTLRTGLSDTETRELMTSSDMDRVVQLVKQGLIPSSATGPLPA